MGTEETTARKALALIREHAAQRHNQFGGSFEDWILDVCYDARTRDMEALEARDERCDPDVAQAIGETLVQYARALRERSQSLTAKAVSLSLAQQSMAHDAPDTGHSDHCRDVWLTDKGPDRPKSISD